MYIFSIEKLSYQQVFDLLNRFDDKFVPKLSEELDIENYAKKMSDNALFAVYRKESNIVAFVAYYLNLELSVVYITCVCVDSAFERKGLAFNLILKLKSEYSRVVKNMALEVRKDNLRAFNLYKNLGFIIVEDRGEKWYMKINF
jgi:ribosomal protein S18 acetylase RimI-like enzyme